jgi:hypothetical protein
LSNLRRRMRCMVDLPVRSLAHWFEEPALRRLLGAGDQDP